MLSIALVVQTILHLHVEPEEGTNSPQAASRRRTIAGCFPPQASVNSMNRSSAASSAGAVQTGLSAFAVFSQSWRAA